MAGEEKSTPSISEAGPGLPAFLPSSCLDNLIPFSIPMCESQPRFFHKGLRTLKGDFNFIRLWVYYLVMNTDGLCLINLILNSNLDLTSIIWPKKIVYKD